MTRLNVVKKLQVVSVTPPINTFEPSNRLTILIILFISSFKINTANLFPALTVLVPLIFLSNLFIALEIKFVTNRGKLSVAKGIAIFASAFFPKLASRESKDLRE